MISNRYLIILAIILCIPAGCYGLEIPPDLQIITENYPPLNYIENGTLQGISVDLMELAFERLDIPVNRSSFQVLPWSEGYTRALNTPNTMLFSTARLPERESQFLWAGPLVSAAGIRCWSIRGSGSRGGSSHAFLCEIRRSQEGRCSLI